MLQEGLLVVTAMTDI